MNVSYLTDTEVRLEYLKLLEAIDSVLADNEATSSEAEGFWGSLGYSVAEIPQY